MDEEQKEDGKEMLQLYTEQRHEKVTEAERKEYNECVITAVLSVTAVSAAVIFPSVPERIVSVVSELAASGLLNSRLL